MLLDVPWSLFMFIAIDISLYKYTTIYLCIQNFMDFQVVFINNEIMLLLMLLLVFLFSINSF